MSSDAFLNDSPLIIRQRKEWVEILVDWETTNKYEVLDSSGSARGFVAERAGGLWAKIRRWLLRSHRPLEIDVMDQTGQKVLELSRPFFWFFSDLAVDSPNDGRQGIVNRRFGILHKKYDLRDATGQLFARIRSPLWRLWTFPVLDGRDGQQRAVITKKWSGALKELFTDADTYAVDFGSHPWSPDQRAVLFAAAVSIDFDFFENNQGRGGVTSWLPGMD